MSVFAMAVLVVQLSAAAQALDCAQPVPPTDFDAAGRPILFEQETVTGPLSSTEASLQQQAREQLVRRLCRLPRAADCAPLAAAVKPGLPAFGTTTTTRCAMAIVSRDDVEAWRRSLAPELDASVRSLAARLAGRLGDGTRAVVIRGVDDNGARGGARATWWVNRTQAALSAVGIAIVEPPSSWNGSAPWPPATRMLRGELVGRTDPLRQLDVVEALWRSSADGITWLAEATLEFPAAMAPPAPTPLSALPTRGDALVVHIDAHADGSLCHGELTQLFVTNRSSQPLHVRVLNLDTRDNVLVLFPNDQRADDVVAAGATVALADAPLEIEGAVGERERYVVLGAADEVSLGRFARVRNAATPACRLRRDEARTLSRGTGWSAPQVAETGFTVLDDASCRERPRATESADLSALPWCP